MNAGSTESRYDAGGEYLLRNPDWHVEGSAWKAQHVCRILRDHDIEPSRIVDIGCGAGEVLRQISDRYPDAICVGCDVSPDALRLAEQRQGDRLTFRQVEWPDEGFDVALALDVIEHTENPFAFARRLKDVATYKVLHIPLDLFALAAVLNEPLNGWRERTGHLHAFTRDLALTTLTEQGFEIIEARYTPSSSVSPADSLKARLLETARRRAFGRWPAATVRLIGGYSLLVLAR